MSGDEIGKHHLLDPCLAERRQHTFDVPQEHAVGTDHEHALVLERKAMRVQQVRGAMQRDDRLSRSRSTLHDEHTRMWGTNDLVLFGLDRRHDVAELAGATTTESGEQRAVSTNALTTDDARQSFVVSDAEVTLAEQLVLDAEQRASFDGEVSSAHEPHRLATSGTIERLGNRGSPVDDHRFPIEVGDGKSPDVEALESRIPFGRAVDPAEHEGRVPEVELGQSGEQLLVEGIALVAGLEGATHAGLVQVTDAPGVGLAAFEALVRSVDVGLLGLVVGVQMAHFGVHQLYRRQLPPRPGIELTSHGTLGTHIPVVTSLLSAEAELSRTTSFLFALILGLTGCARDTESSLFPSDFAELNPIALSATTNPPLATPDVTSPIAIDSRAAIVRDFAAAIAERTRCGQRPDRCAITAITATESEYRTFLTKLMAERVAAGFRTLPGRGDFRYRIESIELTDVGHAVVHTCSLDSVVLFDLGHSIGAAESTTNPIIVDDAVISARTRWELFVESGRWKWVSARGTEMNMEEDLCGFDMD